MAESVGTIRHQNVLLREAHQCSSDPSYNPYELYRCVKPLDEKKFRQGHANCPKTRHDYFLRRWT